MQSYSKALLGPVCLSAVLVGGLTCGSDDGSPARDSTSGSSPTTANETAADAGVEYCVPGEVRCNGQQFLETCAPTGLQWTSEACPTNAFCQPCDAANDTCAADRCVSPCDIPPEFSSSVGCSFIANRQLHPFEDFEDGIVIGNPSNDLTATVDVFMIPEGKRKEELVETFTLLPGEAFPYRIGSAFVLGSESMFRTGGMFRISSDVPILGYQHSPFENNQSNDSLLLLPENVLGTDYVVTSYPPIPTVLPSRPSYFEIIALEDQTTVEWTPPYPTHGNGLPIPPIEAGETGTLKMNRFDTMRITASNKDTSIPLYERDISGTVIHSDKPIWVVGATRCTGAPVHRTELFYLGTCNNVQELLFPIQHWGRRYVAPAAPPRGEEPTHWRIYSGAPNTTIQSNPPHDDLPHTFSERGEYIDISVPAQQHLFLDGDGPFMPVLHLQANAARIWNDETMQAWDYFPPGIIPGDTSMAQMVPVDQFLNTYVFITGIGYLDNWAVVIRQAEGADIIVDGNVVENYIQVGEFEVAHVPITNILDDDTDVHRAESTAPFGLLQVGYSRRICPGEDGADGCVNPNPESTCTDNIGWCNSSYAHPGGMKAEVLYVP
jgi:hypothetical protein